jgi:hypothetical protein
MKNVTPFAMLGLLVLVAGCGDHRDDSVGGATPKVNSNASLPQPATETPAPRADAEDPGTGTNSHRPDSPRDLQPGTDGNTPAVR